jgi:hypothetical protein
MLRPHLVGDRLEPVSQEIAPREHGEHVRRRHRGRDIDCLDARMGMGRTHHHGVGLSGQVDVVGVAAVAGDEAEILLAADWLSDAGARCVFSHARFPIPTVQFHSDSVAPREGGYPVISMSSPFEHFPSGSPHECHILPRRDSKDMLPNIAKMVYHSNGMDGSIPG